MRTSKSVARITNLRRRAVHTFAQKKDHASCSWRGVSGVSATELEKMERATGIEPDSERFSKLVMARDFWM